MIARFLRHVSGAFEKRLEGFLDNQAIMCYIANSRHNKCEWKIHYHESYPQDLATRNFVNFLVQKTIFTDQLNTCIRTAIFVYFCGIFFEKKSRSAVKSF